MTALSTLPCVTDGNSIHMKNNLIVTFHRIVADPDNNMIYLFVSRGQYSVTPTSKHQDTFETGATGDQHYESEARATHGSFSIWTVRMETCLVSMP
jgi:hypothetical protein